uniref:Uncharacterized protein n=1 Tax=Arundo donax TaxID=35708 RepID=A0A0A9EEJ6_ARUDO
MKLLTSTLFLASALNALRGWVKVMAYGLGQDSINFLIISHLLP